MAASVLHLSKRLDAEPGVPAANEIRVRNYVGTSDIDQWLLIRQQAFADECPAVRPWTEQDFVDQILQTSWWSPDRFWVAQDLQGQSLGSVICAARGKSQVPVVHWLAVIPSARRQGIGRLLMQHLEAYCWQRGERQVILETHAGWDAAAQLYRSLGYRSTPAAAGQVVDETDSH